MPFKIQELNSFEKGFDISKRSIKGYQFIGSKFKGNASININEVLKKDEIRKTEKQMALVP